MHLSFSFVQTSFREFGRWVCAPTLRVCKVFTKTGRGPWLRGDSALGPPVYELHSTICIVLLGEFVSRNAWLQQRLCTANAGGTGLVLGRGTKILNVERAINKLQNLAPEGSKINTLSLWWTPVSRTQKLQAGGASEPSHRLQTVGRSISWDNLGVRSHSITS